MTTAYLEAALPEFPVFNGDGVHRKNGIDAIVHRLTKAASGTPWVVGIFAPDGDLRHFAGSGGLLNRRRALGLLCATPLPEAEGTVALRVTGQDGRTAPVLAASTVLPGKRALVFAVLRPVATSDKAWARIAQGLKTTMLQLADFYRCEPWDNAPSSAPAVENSTASGFLLLTSDLKVVYQSSPQDAATAEFANLYAASDGRLPLFLERTIARLTGSWDFTRVDRCKEGVATPVPGLMVRVAPIVGTSLLIGVFLAQTREPADQPEAAFRISPREREVLHALLDGDSVRDVAARLHLAQSTVQDHIARLIEKTHSRNRIEMAAMYLGWRHRKLRTASTKSSNAQFAEAPYGYGSLPT
ncbi:MAG: helix-turn-helix transcriptional regulator [Candidatus Eremiobacteraeota bacterium]|nr:helix-turn-helix transcriptional regulator [Candidatus Eremiobacteraeota bacterium]MBV9055359.1 helix-turn-helix transcriptional regulator [Candidatus Eremiobacteraeota bacterium]MBV9700650.1 helix-turn-helix transcriptional regulator [Candidatus Eremiobacteraeota bacterium]